MCIIISRPWGVGGGGGGNTVSSAFKYTDFSVFFLLILEAKYYSKILQNEAQKCENAIKILKNADLVKLLVLADS